MNERLYVRARRALETFRKEYAGQHRTTINRRLHLYGRITRVAAILLCFYRLKPGIALFFAGWGIQLLGHAIEGSSVSFLRNPGHLFLGILSYPLFLLEMIRRTAARLPGRSSGR